MNFLQVVGHENYHLVKWINKSKIFGRMIVTQTPNWKPTLVFKYFRLWESGISSIHL